jgi:hypothetical protein
MSCAGRWPASPAEVERLRSAASAHDVLKSIYSDANQPTGHRLKAAGLALGHESPPLKPAEAPTNTISVGKCVICLSNRALQPH